MYKLTLEWAEGSQIRSKTITDNDTTIIPNTIRIGRGDETQCDVVLKHPEPEIEYTVSRVHAEISFDTQKNGFFLRNLTQNRQSPKQPNPVIVEGKKIITEDVKLQQGTQIQLGKMSLTIKALEIPDTNLEYIVKCSGPKQHIVDKEYEGLNCPYCGYIVFTGTVLKI